MTIQQAADQVDPMLADLRTESRGAVTFQEAAQRVTQRIRAQFTESVVLARTYATVPFRKLPGPDRLFVRSLAETSGAAESLLDDTTVLSLLGTAGMETAWCHRSRSQKHLGIPLISAQFVSEIPMISGVIERLGSASSWFTNSSVRNARVESFFTFTDSFFVGDAANTRDAAGRLLIPAQDFVGKYNVRSVFGVGGQFSASGTILLCILFSNEVVPHTPRWLSRVPLILATTASGLLASGAIYDIG